MTVNRQKWTIEEDALIISLFQQAYLAGEIAKQTNRSEEAIRKRLRDRGMTFIAGIDKAEQGRQAALKVTAGSQRPDVHRRAHEIKANVLHLIDLKRAGHSASKTEFRITPDYATYSSISFFDGSAMGSSAAMMEEAS